MGGGAGKLACRGAATSLFLSLLLSFFQTMWWLHVRVASTPPLPSSPVPSQEEEREEGIRGGQPTQNSPYLLPLGGWGVHRICIDSTTPQRVRERDLGNNINSSRSCGGGGSRESINPHPFNGCPHPHPPTHPDVAYRAPSDSRLSRGGPRACCCPRRTGGCWRTPPPRTEMTAAAATPAMKKKDRQRRRRWLGRLRLALTSPEGSGSERRTRSRGPAGAAASGPP